MKKIIVIIAWFLTMTLSHSAEWRRIDGVDEFGDKTGVISIYANQGMVSVSGSMIDTKEKIAIAVTSFSNDIAGKRFSILTTGDILQSSNLIKLINGGLFDVIVKDYNGIKHFFKAEVKTSNFMMILGEHEEEFENVLKLGNFKMLITEINPGEYMKAVEFFVDVDCSGYDEAVTK